MEEDLSVEAELLGGIVKDVLEADENERDSRAE